jgi:uncharacterized delta-60 repeat protein
MLNILNLQKPKDFWTTKRFLILSFVLFIFNQSHAQSGTLDFSFDSGMSIRGGVYCTSIQSDGKIIVGGELYNHDLTESFGVARLNKDGSLDTSFQQGVYASWVSTVSIQSDGKIIIGGRFISSNETHITRLNANGSLDTSFDVGMGSGIFNVVNSSSIQSDGKIIIGGAFSSYNGISRNSIACLNTDGSLDTSFDPGKGASPEVNTTSIQDDGKIILGGLGAYNETPRRGVARILGTLYLDILIENVENITIFPNPFSDKATLITNVELENAELTVYNSLGKRVRQINNINGHMVVFQRNNLPMGLYFIQFTQGDRIIGSDKILIAE